MKKILFTITLWVSSFAFSQQAQTFSEVTIQNYSPVLYLKRSTNDGGFIRGIQTQYLNGDNGWFLVICTAASGLFPKEITQIPNLLLMTVTDMWE